MASVLYVGHATTLIELDGVRLLTDPLLRRHVGHLQRLVPFGEDLPAVDAVLLSHQHADHLDVPSLRRLGQSTLMLVPRGAGWTLKRQGFRRVVELSPGESTSVGELAIAAVPAVHDGRRYPYGRKVAALGYVVTGSRSVYFAGDTDVFDGMSELAGADVGLIPVSGWGAKVGPGHLDPARAAAAVGLLRPRVAIPIHWGTYAPLHWRVSGGKSPSEDPAAEFAAAVAIAAPEVEVRVLRPGERTEF